RLAYLVRQRLPVFLDRGVRQRPAEARTATDAPARNRAPECAGPAAALARVTAGAQSRSDRIGLHRAGSARRAPTCGVIHQAPNRMLSVNAKSPSRGATGPLKYFGPLPSKYIPNKPGIRPFASNKTSGLPRFAR